MADVYRIGVEIALTGTLAAGLEAIAGKLLGINARVKDVEGGFSRWGTALAGVASIMGSGAIVKALEKTVSAGGDLVKQQALLLNMGVSQRDVLETTARAQQATHAIIGTTIAENVKGMRELMGVMPNLQEAQKAYVPVMQGAKALESMTGAPADQSLQILAKAIELRGGGINPQTHELDPSRFLRETEAAVKAIIASGGLANARQLLNLMQQAGPMARMTTDADTFYKSILTAVMDMGGFRAGTALTAVGRQLLGGKMTAPTAEEMERMGLLPAGGWHKAGVGVYVEPNALKGMDLLRGDEASVGKWFNDVLLTQFATHGITDPTSVQQELYRLFGTETARRMAGLFIQNKAQITRDASLYDQALGGQSYENVAKGDLTANVTNLHDAVVNFLEAFGAPMVPVAIQALHSIADSINSLAGIAIAHPDAMRAVGEGMVALSAGLAVFGTGAVAAALVALAPGGVVAAGIAGLAAAIGAMSVMNWGAVKDGLASVGQSIGDLWKTIASNVQISWGGLSGLFNPELMRDIAAAGNLASTSLNALANAIRSLGSMASSAINAIKGAFSGLSSGGGVPSTQTPGYFLTPQHYVPPAPGSSSGPHTQTAALYIDGRRAGDLIMRRQMRGSDHPTTAPLFDTYGQYASGDYGFQTG